MGSKISKQKQMFSLLNYKFGNLWEESTVESEKAKNPGDSQFTRTYSNHLLNKVYNFYKSIIQNLNNGLIALDLNGEITFVNHATYKMLNYEQEELLGKNIKDIIGPDLESQKCIRAIFLPHKRINDKEIHFLQKNGSSIVVGVSSSQVHDENNNFDGIIVLFRDLTEIRHLKLQIERMERLAILGELSAGIAHEIRNPLAGVKAAAQLLQEQNDHNELQNQIVERIIREVDKANKLLKEFFKFARPAKPNLKFHDIELIIDGVFLLLAPQIRKNRIEFQTEFGGGVPQVYVDDTQIEQVMINMFLNAIDAMPHGGTLQVKTYRKNLNILEARREGINLENGQLQYVFVDVSDTGVGIPEQNLEKIFNPFFTTKPNGLGLGLSICSRLLGENGGNLDVRSTVGKGTTITFALPAHVHH